MFERVNCIGYVYNQVGISDSEIYCPLPTLKETLQLFDVVPPDLAEVVGVASRTKSENGELVFVHMAMIEDGGAAVKHRPAYGQRVRTGDVDVELELYLLTETNMIFHLRRKNS